MSLLEYLTLSDYRKIKSLTLNQCKKFAKSAKLNICFNDVDFPGIHLVLHLDSIGFTIYKYHELMIYLDYFVPKAKVAILIANDLYMHSATLATPQNDREALGASLIRLGFFVINIKNTLATELKRLLFRFTELIPEDSFCFIFYGGYGCQIGNTKYMLGVDFPMENMEMEHCVTENDMLIMLRRCKPDLCVLIMDFSRITMYIERAPLLYDALKDIKEYTVHNNLIIGYFTHSPQPLYGTHLRSSCSDDENEPSRPLTSQYITALCARLREQIDISSVLTKVHEDMENAEIKPLKLQYGTKIRFFCERFEVNTKKMMDAMTDLAFTHNENCSVCMF